MKKDEIGGKLRDIQDEIIRTLIGITEVLDPKNSNSSYYKEAIMANLNRANREVFAAAENIKFYENADSKEYKKVSEK